MVCFSYFRLQTVCLAVGAATAIFISVTALASKTAPKGDITLQVGVIQRFGSEDKDQLTLSSPGKEALKFSFVDQAGKPITLEAKQATLGIQRQSLPQPKLLEFLVLSDHATFETAEDSAEGWRKKGIPVEVAQPERWQVWAKRSVYNSPLVRRWLLQDLKAQGQTFPYLNNSLIKARPQTFLTLENKTYPIDQVTITSPKALIQVTQGKQKRLYGGSLKLQPNAHGSYTLVNAVPLETYLRGVVPHEIGPNAPFNAAKAQTIIARTYALRNLRRFAADNYQLCATTHCQVYYGLQETSPQADKAIAETRGMVLTYNNELVDALYSSTTGGVTARFSDVWNGQERPYLQAVIDAPKPVWNLAQKDLSSETSFQQFINLKEGFNETGRKVFRWRYPVSLAELTKDLKSYLEKQNHSLANFQRIQSMEIIRRSPSGRVLQLNVTTDAGVVELHKNEARSAFKAPRSTLFYLEPILDQQKRLQGYAFVGGGFGHGVGLSQFGSYKLAQLGWSADKILSFYYPGAKVQVLNESIIFWQEPDR
ncbi:MAG: SpoIID/LytB domain-containing protein [Cyanobacteria bacterium RI_101]|nr:SpoIID/LytB domain-containing protein [Cyanobacteria bacterium RI_101]